MYKGRAEYEQMRDFILWVKSLIIKIKNKIKEKKNAFKNRKDPQHG